jgi:hypothetical protein
LAFRALHEGLRPLHQNTQKLVVDMRRLNLSTILLAAFVLNQPALANSESEKTATAPPDQSVTTPAEAPESVSGELRTSQKEPGQRSRDEICQMIEAAAGGEELPFEFLARLIWQESKFNPAAVSPAGAVGIAQFMPKVATGRGLANPLEPQAALHESAEFLRELRDRFGNLGLAAAAYNAGPKRVQNWLAKRGSLPRETRNYVQIITGHRAEKWTTSAPSVETAEFRDQQCGQIAKLSAQRYRLAALERFASAVDQRVKGKQEARKSARGGVLAKRNVPANHVEQVAKLTARAGKLPRVDKIIRLTAQSRGNKAVRVADTAKAKPTGGKAVKVAANLASKSSAVSAQEKKTAAAKPTKRSAAAKVRVASNERKKS